jgi:hypothetical protein
MIPLILATIVGATEISHGVYQVDYLAEDRQLVTIIESVDDCHDSDLLTE